MHSYRINAGRRMRWDAEQGKSVQKANRIAPMTPYQPPTGYFFSMSKDQLVADGSGAAMAELQRRGRNERGVKLAWIKDNPMDAIMNPSEEHKQILIGAAIGFALCWFTKDSIKARMNP